MKTATIIFFVFCALVINAQEDTRFKLAFTGGAVGSQMDFDDNGGYNKVGPLLAVYVKKPISEKTDFDFGLSYVQKGVRKNATLDDPNYYIARLNYVEVPFLIAKKFKVKYRFEGGLSFAYLFNKKEESTQVGKITTPFNPIDFCYNLGLGYHISDRLYINARYNYSFLPVRNYNKNVYIGTFLARYLNRGLYNNVIQVSINYTISPKSKSNE